MFVRQSCCAAAAGTSALAACGGVTWTPVPAPGNQVTLDLDAHPELAVGGGSLRILPEGHRDPVYVLEVDGSHVALSPICTHRGCTVDIEGARLVCPCHGSTYERTGAVVRGPAERPLRVLPTRREGRRLHVDVREVQP